MNFLLQMLFALVKMFVFEMLSLFTILKRESNSFIFYI